MTEADLAVVHTEPRINAQRRQESARSFRMGVDPFVRSPLKRVKRTLSRVSCQFLLNEESESLSH
jgi:hypothetical protein